VQVTNTPDVLTEDVADMAFAVILASFRRIVEGDAFVRSGAWTERALPLGRSLNAKNVSRDSAVDEPALIAALEEKRIGEPHSTCSGTNRTSMRASSVFRTSSSSRITRAGRSRRAHDHGQTRARQSCRPFRGPAAADAGDLNPSARDGALRALVAVHAAGPP